MKKTLVIIAAIVMIAGFSTTLLAQNTISSDAAAKIVSALTVSNHDANGLHFGTMTIPTAATTVVVDPDGTRTGGANITMLAQTPTHHVASYDVTGDGTATYLITLPTTDITITNQADNTKTMIVNTFKSSKGSTNIGTLVVGIDAFTVGATLNLGINQAAGLYTGTYNVSVAYN